MARILIVDDQPMVLKCLKSALSADGHDVATVSAGDMALKLVGFQPFDIIITDYAMPGMDGLRFLEVAQQKSPGVPVIMITGYGTPETALEAMEKGAFDYLTKPFSLEALRSTVAAALEYVKARNQIPNLVNPEPCHLPFPNVVAASASMKVICSQLAQWAMQDKPILFQGERGTGKELLARATHWLSPRRDKLFERIECRNVREGGTIGSLLHYARAGSLFLHEVTDLSPTLQRETASILMSRRFHPAENAAPVTLETTFFLSTRRNVEEALRDGKIHPELYEAVRHTTITIPPLRERIEDLRVYIGLFLKQYVSPEVSPIEPEALLVLEKYPWPGNLPELEETLRNAAVLSGGKTIRLSHLPRGLVRLAQTGDREDTRKVNLDEFRGRVVKSFLQNIKQEYEELLSKIDSFTASSSPRNAGSTAEPRHETSAGQR